jgi:hypothetical protein
MHILVDEFNTTDILLSSSVAYMVDEFPLSSSCDNDPCESLFKIIIDDYN